MISIGVTVFAIFGDFAGIWAMFGWTAALSAIASGEGG